jgi:hypothetical protein
VSPLILFQIAAKINQPGAGDAQPQGIKRPFEDEAHFGNLVFLPHHQHLLLLHNNAGTTLTPTKGAATANFSFLISSLLASTSLAETVNFENVETSGPREANG